MLLIFPNGENDCLFSQILLFYAFFGPSGGKEMGELLRIVKVWTKQLKVLFCIHFRIELDCTLGMVLSLLAFVDWLGSPEGAVAYFCVFAPSGFCCLYTSCILLI